MTDAMRSALDILIQERDQLNQAISILQGRVAVEAPKRRGRPPKAASAKKVAKKKRGRPEMSAEARKAVSERMRKYWAKRRKEKKAAAK